MIRVLNIVGDLEYGGLKTSIINYYRHIDRSKVQFDFLLTTDRDPKDEKFYYEDEVISMGARIFRRPTRTKHLLKHMKATYRIYKENPDIKIVHMNHAHSGRPASDAVLAMLAGMPVRIVYSSIDIRAIASIVHKMLRPLVRLTATHWLAGSVDAGVSMFGDKAERKLIIVPRARDLELFRYSPSRRDSIRQKMDLCGSYIVINVGRLAKQKNQMFLLEAFACAHKKQPDMILLIAGDGNLDEYLTRKAYELGINDSVRFLGRCDNVPDLLQAADLFVLPSLYEGLPGAAVEAQAAGLPCLLADTISRESKIIDAVEFLPIDKNPEVWAERMLAYQGFRRRDTAEEIRKAGYDIKDAAKWLEEFYLEAAGF